jgi:hypothetical protein
MTRVLLVGLKPEAVDYSDPALPAGMNAEKIQTAIDLGLKQMTDRGWRAEACLIEHDAIAGPAAVERRLSATTYDCVVVGAGVRLPPKSLLLFEAIVNAVHKTAPNTSIAFNTVPQDSADAAARWLSTAN